MVGLFTPQLQQQMRPRGENRFHPVHLRMTAKTREISERGPTSPAPAVSRLDRKEHRRPGIGSRHAKELLGADRRSIQHLAA